MRRLYEALIQACLRWLSPPAQEPLTPDVCQCDHSRCTHKDGVGRCHGQFPPDSKTPQWTDCSCQVFVKDDDDDDDDDEPDLPTPSADEMERMFK